MSTTTTEQARPHLQLRLGDLMSERNGMDKYSTWTLLFSLNLANKYMPIDPGPKAEIEGFAAKIKAEIDRRSSRSTPDVFRGGR